MTGAGSRGPGRAGPGAVPGGRGTAAEPAVEPAMDSDTDEPWGLGRC